MRTVRSFSACAAMLASACAPSIVAPDARHADASIRDAIDAGGRDDPSASYYLALAERELAEARVAARVGDAEGAERAARRARADADLARLYALETATLEAARRSEADALSLERAIDAPAPPARVEAR